LYNYLNTALGSATLATLGSATLTALGSASRHLHGSFAFFVQLKRHLTMKLFGAGDGFGGSSNLGDSFLHFDFSGGHLYIYETKKYKKTGVLYFLLNIFKI
jgi:hypothetical protein